MLGLTALGDKVVLHLHPPFLPNGVSDFHLNKDLVLPFLFPWPLHSKEVVLHSLDVVHVYLSAMASFWRSDSLFVSTDGPRKGLVASSANIT